jgi:hypothetical protein
VTKSAIDPGEKANGQEFAFFKRKKNQSTRKNAQQKTHNKKRKARSMCPAARVHLNN